MSTQSNCPESSKLRSIHNPTELKTPNSQNENKPKIKELVLELRNQFKLEYYQNENSYLKLDYDRIVNSGIDWHCARYLKHYGMDIEKAFEGMKCTLRWRKEVKIDEINKSLFPKELWMYSIIIFCGTSKDDCEVVYALLNRYRPISDPEIRDLFQRFILYLIETEDNACPYDRDLLAIIEETNASVMHVDIDMVRWFIQLRDYWPGRFKSINIIGLPLLIKPMVRMIVKWLPKEWRDKVKVGTVDELLLNLVDTEKRIWSYGGSKDATCKLASAGTKWAKDMEMFKDEEKLNNLKKAFCDHIPKEEREFITELQIEHDRKYNAK